MSDYMRKPKGPYAENRCAVYAQTVLHDGGLFMLHPHYKRHERQNANKENKRFYENDQ
jgi:hypothetical protein